MYEATADRDHLVELIRKYSGVFQDEAEAARLEELEIGVPTERIKRSSTSGRSWARSGPR